MSEDTEKYGRKLSLSAYDKKHLQNLLKQAKLLEKQFDDAVREAVRLGAASGFTDPNGEFTFDNFPAIKERAEKLFQQFHDSIVATITDGNREEWLLSAAKNDALVDKFAAKYGERAKQWKDPNLTALQRFNERKERGMNLSDRVWKLSDQFKGELELSLELGLGEGKSAADLSRDVRQYLREPNKLFRRVRNEKGQLRLSKAAQAYHPGQGVYRSSYKNALRLTATENNMAYRTADHERWQQLDFVIGIQIMLSNNHTCNGQPFVDICDTLQGMYPKTFKFVGWHPFCRCIAVPKLANEDEFIAQQQALIDGEEYDTPFSGEVTELPSSFVNWVEDNQERINEATSEPYFIRDNRKHIEKAVKGLSGPSTTTAIDSVKWFDTLVDKTKAAFLSNKCPASLSEMVIRSTVKQFAAANPALFNGGLEALVIKRGGGGEMMHNSRSYDRTTGKRTTAGNTICIRNNKLKLIDPTTGKPCEFNPFYEVRGALRAIAKNQSLTFNQEYSLESLWHEIYHASAPGWSNLKSITPALTGSMEVANQFCARHSYDKFIIALGGTASHTADVIKSGYGYSRRLTNFNALLKAKNIDEAATFKELSTALRTKPYEDIEATMIDWIAKHGVEKAKAADLIQKLQLSTADYAKLL